MISGVRDADHDVPSFQLALPVFQHAAPASLSDPEVQFLLIYFWCESVFEAAKKPKTPAICFICSRLKPPTQQRQTTGGCSHICCRDLERSDFIVRLNVSFKRQFSLLRGLDWFKTVSDVGRGIFFFCELCSVSVVHPTPAAVVSLSSQLLFFIATGTVLFARIANFQERKHFGTKEILKQPTQFPNFWTVL